MKRTAFGKVTFHAENSSQKSNKIFQKIYSKFVYHTILLILYIFFIIAITVYFAKVSVALIDLYVDISEDFRKNCYFAL